MTEKKSSGKDNLRARLQKAAPPAEDTAPKSAKVRQSRKSTQTKAPTPLRRPEHPDTPSADVYTKRVPVSVTPDMARALDMAKLDDGLTRAARIRGMIEYWMEGLPEQNTDTGETGQTGRQTKAINQRARKHRG